MAGAAAGLALPPLPATAQNAATPARGGTLNYLIDPEPSTLNCFNTTEGPAIQASSKVLEGLLTYDYDLNPQPRLATSWTVSEDGLEYRFTCAGM